MQILMLRFEGPMMSFGDVAVDHLRGTDTHPLKSMVVGIIANALGLLRTEPEKIQEIQEGIDVASRLDRPGTLMTDYQTVLLGTGTEKDEKPGFVRQTGWSTRGHVMGRSNTDDTYQIWRDYRADASVAVAVAVDEERIGLARIEAAVRQPRRPVFLGRKACPPTRPIFEDVVEADDAAQALIDGTKPGTDPVSLRWSSVLGDKGLTPIRRQVSDLRDWRNRIAVGQREVFESLVRKEQAA